MCEVHLPITIWISAEDVLHYGRPWLQTDFRGAGGCEQRQSHYAIREEDIPQICEEYDKLAKEMVEEKKQGKGFQLLPFHD